MIIHASVDLSSRTLALHGVSALAHGDVCTFYVGGLHGALTDSLEFVVYASDRSTELSRASAEDVDRHSCVRRFRMTLAGGGYDGWRDADGGGDKSVYLVLADAETTYAACEVPFIPRP